MLRAGPFDLLDKLHSTGAHGRRGQALRQAQQRCPKFRLKKRRKFAVKVPEPHAMKCLCTSGYAATE